MADNGDGRCRTCRGEGEVETGQTTAARCVDCGGSGHTGGEPPNRPLPPPDPRELSSGEAEAAVTRALAAIATVRSREASPVVETTARPGAPSSYVILPGVYAAVEAERDRQRSKDYTSGHDDRHHLADFGEYIARRVDEVARCRIHGCGLPYYRALYVEVAALAVAALEKIGRMPGGGE